MLFHVAREEEMVALSSGVLPTTETIVALATYPIFQNTWDTTAAIMMMIADGHSLVRTYTINNELQELLISFKRGLDKADAENAVKVLKEAGEDAYILGELVESDEGVIIE